MRKGAAIKHPGYSLAVLSLLFLVQISNAQERDFGLGVIVGDPTGLSAKLWTSPSNALDFGLGWSNEGDHIGRYYRTYGGRTWSHFHVDYLWHSFSAIRSSERFPLYYGIGGQINYGAGYSSAPAVRGVFGIEWIPRRTSLDVFFEIAPSLQLISPTGFAMEAGLGTRYFF